MLSLDDLFTLIATTSYWVIVVLWLAILSIFLGKLRRTHGHDEAFRVLILVLAIDAFRTVFENLYFGIYFNAFYGIIPASLQQLLGDPALLMLPKLANVAAGVLVFALLARRWLPSAEREREAMVRTLHESQDEAARLKDRYQLLVDASPDLICSLDRQGRLVDVGARWRPCWRVKTPHGCSDCWTTCSRARRRAKPPVGWCARMGSRCASRGRSAGRAPISCSSRSAATPRGSSRSRCRRIVRCALSRWGS